MVFLAGKILFPSLYTYYINMPSIFYPSIHPYKLSNTHQIFSNSNTILFALFLIDCPVHLNQEHFPVLKTIGMRIAKNVSNIEFMLFVLYLSFCKGPGSFGM